MKQRKNPCLCIICECGSIVIATSFSVMTFDKEFIDRMEEKAKEGYAIECIDAESFQMGICKCKRVKV